MEPWHDPVVWELETERELAGLEELFSAGFVEADFVEEECRRLNAIPLSPRLKQRIDALLRRARGGRTPE